MVYRSQPVPVASPRGDVIPTGRMAAHAPGRQNKPSIPEPPYRRRIRSAGDAVATPLSPAEVAQARIFESTLQAELHRLQDSVVTLTTRPNSDEQQAGEQLRTLMAGIEEVDRLLKALRYRFLFAGIMDVPAEQGIKSAHLTPADRNAHWN
jgi:hypothetical protein